MTVNTNYLPKYTLNQLADRVAMKVDYISRLYKADKVWENIIELCQEIEAEPRNVNTVIIEVKKNPGTAITGTNIRWYHVKLTLIYILLYYRHSDDDIFKKTVLNQLAMNMGVYAEDKILKNKIQSEIDKIKEDDKLLEQEDIKSQSTPSAPSAGDMAEGRKKFIQAINAGLVKVDSFDWADVTMGFDKTVMEELFWGVEDDELLKNIVKAIINRWKILVESNDNRCMKNNGTGLSAFNMKFGGVLQADIDVFFDNLWTQRNARNIYSSVKNVVIPTLDNNNQQSDTSQQEKLNSGDLELFDSLKVRVEELEREKKLWEAEKKNLNAKITELEKSSEWIGCFDGFLHPSLNPQAIADALNKISSPHLPKSERSYWWVFITVLTEINWISQTNYKLTLQWANFHFNCGWDWKKNNQFKFSDINEKIKSVQPSSKWNKSVTGSVIGDYYGELAKTMKETFVVVVNGNKLLDKAEFILPGCPFINNGRK